MTQGCMVSLSLYDLHGIDVSYWIRKSDKTCQHPKQTKRSWLDSGFYTWTTLYSSIYTVW